MDTGLFTELGKHRLIAIARGLPKQEGMRTAAALYEGGIRFLELPLNGADALATIEALRKEYAGRMFIGAGTVLNTEDAKRAVQAGAQYLISPNLDESVIAYGLSQKLEVWPGVMTPTEIVRAVNAGVQAVKLFPMASLGLSYFKEVRAPLNAIPMIPTGMKIRLKPEAVIASSYADRYTKKAARALG